MTTIDAPSKADFRRAKRTCVMRRQVVLAFAGFVLWRLLP